MSLRRDFLLSFQYVPPALLSVHENIFQSGISWGHYMVTYTNRILMVVPVSYSASHGFLVIDIFFELIYIYTEGIASFTWVFRNLLTVPFWILTFVSMRQFKFIPQKSAFVWLLVEQERMLRTKR